MTTKEFVLSQFKKFKVWDSCELQRACGPGTRALISDLRARGIAIHNYFVTGNNAMYYNSKKEQSRRRYFYELVTPKYLIDFKNCRLKDE